MVYLTGFADEIAADLDVQLEVLQSEGIRHVEFRGVWNKNVLKLSDEELLNVKDMLVSRGFGVSSIGSPIGKISIQDDFAPHLKDFERAVHIAKMLGTDYIRIFSFFIPKRDDPMRYRDEVMRRMGALVERAEMSGLTLLHENEKEIYGDNAQRCLDILSTCSSPKLRMAFDPANFVQCGVRPLTEAYPLLREYVEYVHIKDAMMDTGIVVPAGEGDGEVRALLSALVESGYEGFLSLEPHLQTAETFAGFSGPELFRVASHALKGLLTDLGQSWQ